MLLTMDIATHTGEALKRHGLPVVAFGVEIPALAVKVIPVEASAVLTNRDGYEVTQHSMTLNVISEIGVGDGAAGKLRKYLETAQHATSCFEEALGEALECLGYDYTGITQPTQAYDGGIAEGGGEVVGVSFAYTFYAVKKAAQKKEDEGEDENEEPAEQENTGENGEG